MKAIIKFRVICFACSAVMVLSACYKYQQDISYASINGNVIDGTTNANTVYGAFLQVAMSPAFVTNGSLILDATGKFTNTRIVPGTYRFYTSTSDPYLYAFNFVTDTLSNIDLSAGKTKNVNLKVTLTPWVSLTAAIGSTTASSITVNYTVKSNTSDTANEFAICWDTDSGKVNIKTPPLAGGNYNARLNWGNFIEPNPPNTSPQTSVDGSRSYTISGLQPKTKYYICVMARVPNGKIDPKGNMSNGNGDWWNCGTIISATTN